MCCNVPAAETAQAETEAARNLEHVNLRISAVHVDRPRIPAYKSISMLQGGLELHATYLAEKQMKMSSLNVETQKILTFFI